MWVLVSVIETKIGLGERLWTELPVHNLSPLTGLMGIGKMYIFAVLSLSVLCFELFRF